MKIREPLNLSLIALLLRNLLALKVKLVTLVLALVVLPALAQSSADINAELKRAKTFFSKRQLDSAETLLEELLPLCVIPELRNERIAVLLLSSKVNSRRRKSKKAIEYHLAASDLCKQDDWENRIKLHNSFYFFYRSYNANNLALEQKIKIYEILLEHKTVAFSKKEWYRLMRGIAEGYYKTKNYSKAKIFYKKALFFTSENDLVVSLNNIGLAFRGNGQLDSAEHYFQEGLRILDKGNKGAFMPKFVYGLLLGSQGGLEAKRGHIEKSIKLYEENYKLTRNFPGQLDALYIGNRLIRYYLDQDRIEKAEKITKDIYNIYDKRGNLKVASNVKVSKKNVLTLYTNSLEVYNRAGKLTEAKKMIDSITVLTERIASINEERMFSFIELYSNSIKVEIEQQKELVYQKQLLELKTKAEQQYQFLLFLLPFLFLLLVLWVNNKRKYQLKLKENKLKEVQVELLEMKSKALLQDANKMEEKLGFKNKDITNLSLDLERKQKVIKELFKQFEIILRKEGLINKKVFKLFLTDLAQRIDQNSDFEIIQQNIEDVNAAFFAKLKERFPQLTQNDLQLCALYRLGLSAKEIASMRGIALDSARKARTRLRKKLALNTEDSLVDFLAGF